MGRAEITEVTNTLMKVKARMLTRPLLLILLFLQPALADTILDFVDSFLTLTTYSFSGFTNVISPDPA